MTHDPRPATNKMNYAEKIHQLKLEIPPPPKPAGSYHPVILAGSVAYLSGQISRRGDGTLLTGKVGAGLSLEDGARAARTAALNVLSILQHLVGFEKFERMIRVAGYVQAAGDFYDIPKVMNAASDLFLEVFGERGIHARSAVGTASLPLNAAVEIEATVLLKPGAARS